MSMRFFLMAGAACALAIATPALSSPHTHATQTQAAQLAPTGGMQTGEYHTTITFSDVSGLPPAMAQHMMSTPQTTDACVRTSDINAEVQDAIAAGADMTCSQDHGSASGGVISGAANCHDDDGNSGALAISGSYTATHADVSADLTAQTQMGPVSEHIHLVSDRTGACS